VHCQAGVGRTGIYLAIYLMQKYGWSAQVALKELRRCRPSTCRFSGTKYGINPYTWTPDFYESVVQERFLERWNARRGKTDDLTSEDGCNARYNAEHIARIDKDIDVKEAWIASRPKAVYNPDTKYDCYVCAGIQSIGPYVMSSETINLPRN
jgi:hypothetical protein